MSASSTERRRSSGLVTLLPTASSIAPKLRLNATCCSIAQRLVVKDQHGVPIHPRLDRPDLVGAERPAEVDPLDLAREQRVELANRDRHGQASEVCRGLSRRERPGY